MNPVEKTIAAAVNTDIEQKMTEAVRGKVDLRNAEPGKPSRVAKLAHGLSGVAVAASAAAAASGALGRTIERMAKDVPLSLVADPALREALDKLGPNRSEAPPDALDHTNPLAKFVKVRFDGEVRPDDVLSYNVAEGWIVCGRYVTINGNRIWKRERGRILSYRKVGKVEPFWR